jgi:RNA polymerase sigma factor (sigma-70 family)
MPGEESTAEPEAHRGIFPTTHWSAVLAATDPESAEAVAALEELCTVYWYPIYAYVRHEGHTSEDAKDLTQEFFRRLLEKNYLSVVDPRKGRFRSFLLAVARHFLANEWERARTVKRGGHLTFVPLDEGQAEERYLNEQAAGQSPEVTYERAWALALLEKVLARLREEAVMGGHAARFDALKGVLMGEKPSLSYAQLAVELETTEPALKMAAQRLRGRYGELLREEIGRTVSAPEDVEDELRHLRAVLRAVA